MKIIFILSIQIMIAQITLAQNIGIGTITPNFPLTVIGQNSRGIAQKNESVEVGFFTSSTSAYVQTWSNHPLFFGTNNSVAQMALSTAGNLGIGISAPSARLDVNGNVRIRGGSPAAGMVLTSTDANGNAEWKAPSAGGVKTLNISFTSFFPDRSSIGYTSLATNGRYPASSVTGLVYFEAPLLLPTGTKLISIHWLFVDHNAKDFEFCVTYDDNYSNQPENVTINIGCINSNGSSNAAQALAKSLNNHIMQNTPYYLRASVTDWPSSTSMIIKGARITYE